MSVLICSVHTSAAAAQLSVSVRRRVQPECARAPKRTIDVESKITFLLQEIRNIIKTVATMIYVTHSCLWRGGVVAWWRGGVVVWWRGGVVAWWRGGVVVWWCGGVVVWWRGGVVAWWCVGVVVIGRATHEVDRSAFS